jgi:galactose mutarotase-like enzyme
MSKTPCSLESTIINGWSALILSNAAISVTVLPDKGADIYAFVDRERAVDVLFKAPWGLAAPDTPPRAGSDGHAVLERYEGGWQELFPNTNDPCDAAGHHHPYHGEVASLAWEVTDQQVSAAAVTVTLRVACSLTPLVLTRTMTIAAESRGLVLDETVANNGLQPEPFVWGHHCVLGPPLVSAGAELDVSCRTISTIPEAWEDTARLQPGQREPWPHALLRDGGRVDLRSVPGPEAGSHDDVYLTGLDTGAASVTNHQLGLRFRLAWDHTLFRSVISWQPYGGAYALPLAGSYALGVEPWVTVGNLAEAIASADACWLDPGQTRSTQLTATLEAV